MSNPVINKVVQKHRKWLSRTGKRVADRDRKYLLQDLDEGSADSLKQIPHSLNTLGLYHGAKGVVAVIDGNADGWEDIRVSIELHAWSVYFLFETYLRRHELGIILIGPTNHTPELACVGSVCGSWQPRMLSILTRWRHDPNYRHDFIRPAQRFEEFALAVDQLGAKNILGIGVDISQCEASPYTQALVAWDDSAKLDAALLSICDYHLARIELKSDEEFAPEFKYAPFDLLPCEWMLVSRTRHALGMDTLRTNHPLLSLLSSSDDIGGGQLPSDIEGGLVAIRDKFLKED